VIIRNPLYFFLAVIRSFGTYDERMVIDMFPMKRMGNPQEFANRIVWLCSDESSYTTGHILAIDEGFTARWAFLSLRENFD